MLLAIFIYVIGVLGFVLSKNNIITLLLCLEMMILGITLFILLNSLENEEILGTVLGLYLISIAGAESAIGLAILVVYFKLKKE